MYLTIVKGHRHGFNVVQNRTRLGVRSFRLSPQGEQALLNYSWPGNVRELEHVISRAALKALGRTESRQAIVTLEIEPLEGAEPAQALDSDVAAPPPATALQPLKQALETCQRQQLRLALERSKGNWAAAARLLEIDSSNLHKLAKRLGLKG